MKNDPNWTETKYIFYVKMYWAVLSKNSIFSINYLFSIEKRRKKRRHIDQDCHLPERKPSFRIK